MNEAVKIIVALFLLGIIGFCVKAIPAMRIAYQMPIEEITVMVYKRPEITWQLLLCRNLVKNPDGSVKIGAIDEFLACRDMNRDDI